VNLTRRVKVALRNSEIINKVKVALKSREIIDNWLSSALELYKRKGKY